MELKNRNFVILDTETTGFDDKKHQVLEVGMLVIKDMKIISELEVKIKHKEYTISSGAMKANKINIVEHEEEAVLEEVAADTILQFLTDNKSEEDEGYIVVGQNVNFDIRFLESMFLRVKKIKEYRKVISYRNLDLMQLALIKNIEGKIQLEKQDLDSILKVLNIDIPDKRHRAIVDCNLEYEAIRKLLSL